MAADTITLQAKNTIINGTGSHRPGAVFKCSQTEADFLLKRGAAQKIGKNGENQIPDSKEKQEAIKLSKKEKEKAEKIKNKKAAAFEIERKAAEEKAAKEFETS